MKRIILAFVGAGVASLAVAATPAAAATYTPVGVQTNVALSTVTSGGWTLCHSSLFAQPLGNDSDMALSGCSRGGNLMLAARATGSDTILLLAQAPAADVTFNVGDGLTATHNANGAEWYYSPNYSWGFAGGGDSVNRLQCDTEETNGALRLCWHTISGSGGYRAGIIQGLNVSPDYERLIFMDSDVNAIPEPATWAMMVGGFGLVGAAARRRIAVGYA